MRGQKVLAIPIMAAPKAIVAKLIKRTQRSPNLSERAPAISLKNNPSTA